MLKKKTVSQCINADYCRGWNDAVDAMPRWIPVKEVLPHPGEVLISSFGGYVCVAWYHFDGTFETGGGLILSKTRVSHWMPLPKPPKEET